MDAALGQVCPGCALRRVAWMKGQVVTPMRTYGLRFDVNCSILFTELPLGVRAAAAKAAGFDGVEFW